MNKRMFEGIKFDDKSDELQQRAIGCAGVLIAVLSELEETRERSIAITKLEETIMWCGKAIKQDQIKREN